MKQTPLQKAIEWINKDPTGMLHTYDKHIMTEYLQSLLPYERECIEGAYEDGFNDGTLLSDARAADNDSAHDYFNATFKQ